MTRRKLAAQPSPQSFIIKVWSSTGKTFWLGYHAQFCSGVVAAASAARKAGYMVYMVYKLPCMSIRKVG